MVYTRPHEDRLGDGTPAVDDVLSWTGTGTATWKTPTGGGGGSVTVQLLDGSGGVGSVTVIRSAGFVDNGGGDVSLYPFITATGTPTSTALFTAGVVLTAGSGGAIVLQTAGNVSAIQVGVGGIDAWVEHTPGDLADAGYNFEVGDDYVGLWISEKNSSTIQIYSESSGYDIELKDRASKNWKTVGSRGTFNLNDLHLTKISAAAIAVTQTTIAHGLGATPSVVIITPRGVSFCYESANADATNVYITAAGVTTADIYVAI